MKNDKNQAKAGVRDEDLEALVHQVLRADGKVFPASEKDISNLEAEIDIEEVKPIDPARLLARIRGEKTDESSDKLVPLFGKFRTKSKKTCWQWPRAMVVKLPRKYANRWNRTGSTRKNGSMIRKANEQA